MMSDFKHKMQTKTDAYRLFRTYDDILQWSVNNPDVRIVKAKQIEAIGFLLTALKTQDVSNKNQEYKQARMDAIIALKNLKKFF